MNHIRHKRHTRGAYKIRVLVFVFLQLGGGHRAPRRRRGGGPCPLRKNPNSFRTVGELWSETLLLATISTAFNFQSSIFFNQLWLASLLVGQAIFSLPLLVCSPPSLAIVHYRSLVLIWGPSVLLGGRYPFTSGVPGRNSREDPKISRGCLEDVSSL